MKENVSNGLILGTIHITTSFGERRNLLHVRGYETGQIEDRYRNAITECLVPSPEILLTAPKGMLKIKYKVSTRQAVHVQSATEKF
jgi:hypothetical protein